MVLIRVGSPDAREYHAFAGAGACPCVAAGAYPSTLSTQDSAFDAVSEPYVLAPS